MPTVYSQVSCWLHFHNTRGLGVLAISLPECRTAYLFDTSFSGTAGNVAIEDVVHMCEETGGVTNIDLDKILALSQHLVKLPGHKTDSYLLRAGKSKELIRDLSTEQLKEK